VTKTKPAGNDAFPWSDFDSEAYFQHYYGEPHVDDERVVRLACAALKEAKPDGAALECVDVGTGPNLFPLLCALPRAGRITAWEFSTSNVEWLRAELASDSLRPQWKQFWNVALEAYGPEGALPKNPLSALRQKTRIEQGSIYDLPERRWDAATMFFCAESITEKESEFESACARFARCVRSGGTLVAAFLAGSSGYPVAGRPFPALNISESRIQAVFAPLAIETQTQEIGIVEKEVRGGYTGMIFLKAQAL